MKIKMERSGLPNYVEMMTTMQRAMPKLFKPGFSAVAVRHDDWCPTLGPEQGVCVCHPELLFTRFDGTLIFEVSWIGRNKIRVCGGKPRGDG